MYALNEVKGMKLNIIKKYTKIIYIYMILFKKGEYKYERKKIKWNSNSYI